MNTRIELLTYLAGLTRCQRYLEIGVHDGQNFLAVPSPIKVGVDPSPNPRVPLIHKVKSDEYFDRLAGKDGPFDLVFVDGDHAAAQVRRDVEGALEHLNPRNPWAAIVLHDCNPTTADMAAEVGHHRAWCGTVWKAWVELRMADAAPWARVVDFDYGCAVLLPGVVDPRPASRELLPADFGGRFFELPYEWLDRNRVRALGLMPQDLFLAELGSLREVGGGALRTGPRAAKLLPAHGEGILRGGEPS